MRYDGMQVGGKLNIDESSSYTSKPVDEENTLGGKLKKKFGDLLAAGAVTAEAAKAFITGSSQGADQSNTSTAFRQ